MYTPDSTNAAMHADVPDSVDNDAPKDAADSKGAAGAGGTRTGTRTGSGARASPSSDSGTAASESG